VRFAPEQERAGRLRWSKDFFVTNAKYMPPPPGVRPPSRWGTESGLDELIGAGASAIESEERAALQYYRDRRHGRRGEPILLDGRHARP
jgi:hypothetical protein